MKSPFLITTFVISFTTIFAYPMIGENTSSNQEPHGPQRAITRFHDTLVLLKKSNPRQGRSSNETGRSSSSENHKKYKLLPADDRLRHKYFSEKVEEDLGHIKIGRRRRNEPNNNHLPVPAPPPPTLARVPLEQQQTSPSFTVTDKERVQDLEEIFRILARRDGPLLEQMLSLRDAIDRFYGIFEFMGVANMPAQQRDEAIRKILDRTLNIDVEKAAKKARL